MKRLYLVGFVLVSTLMLTACNTTSMQSVHQFQESLAKRGCASGGDLTLNSGTLTSLPTVTGHYSFDCPKREVVAPQ